MCTLFSCCKQPEKKGKFPDRENRQRADSLWNRQGGDYEKEKTGTALF